ncbi:hypothetical protein N0V82_004077 [Gnomoniopsis sp. IMI 355080]|nr:hypothetical protein N0V82_004077 [Gnomoniopsis sp. IMI 355080]
MDILQTPNPLSKALRDTGVWDGKSLNKALAVENKVPKKKGRPSKDAAKNKEKEAQPEKKDATNTEESLVRQRAAKGDKSRVQITNEGLVKDMIDYIKPTLERHRGCDLVSVYPGAGAWTKALHDAVQPRSHLLLEPDESTYRPFLQPLLDQDNVRLVPKSGIIWEDLDAVLTPEYLPNQVTYDKKAHPDGPPRNDTLLVSMNLAMFPKKRFSTFQSVSRMVLFQLLQTIRTSTLYQKYGQVRMFIWIPDDEKSGVLPRVLGGRRRSAIEGELTTQYIAEVCGRDVVAEDDDARENKSAIAESRNTDRWPQMELESARLCKIRMEQRGIVMPPGRSTTLMRKLDALIARQPTAMKKGISMWEMREAVGGKGVANETEYRELVKMHKKKDFLAQDPNFLRLKALEQYFINLDSAFQHAVEFNKEHDAIVKAYAAVTKAQATKGSSSQAAAKLLARAQKLEAAFDASALSLPKYRREYDFMSRDAVHILTRQPSHLGPVLSWDRRPYEPLPAAAADFFPNVPCALLDIEPKAAHPLLRSMGPGTDNAGDIFDMILGVLSDLMSGSVEKQISALWPGVSEGVLPQCGSLTDPARGGIPLKGAGAITNRCLNSEQLMEILEEFMKWPFRPSHADLVGRLAAEEFSDDDAELYVKGNAAWQTP